MFGQVKAITAMTQHLRIYWSVHLVVLVVTAIDFTCPDFRHTTVCHT